MIGGVQIDLSMKLGSLGFTFNGSCYTCEFDFIQTMFEKYGICMNFCLDEYANHGTVKSLADAYWGYDTSTVFEYELIHQMATGY